MADDPLAAFKAKQLEGWKHFIPTEVHSTPPAATLVGFAGVKPGQKVLDVGTGTGPVAVTAARLGAKVTGLDPTPELLARAKENAGIAEVEDVTWKEGEAENLPFADGTFDVVLSDWGHMFAPRAQRAADEMLRVLTPGGTIAFQTWPPDDAFGQMFQVIGRHLPPPPPGVDAPMLWGDREVVRKRLGERVKDLTFQDHEIRIAAMSPQHNRIFMEATAAPMMAVVQTLRGDPAKLASFRKEVDGILGRHFEDNTIRTRSLLTRATKK